MGYLDHAVEALGKRISKCIFVVMACVLWANNAYAQADLILTNVGNPIVTDSAGVTSGNDYGSRALWANAGTVGGTNVDIIAILETSTQEHRFQTNASRPAVRSSGQDEIWIRWYLYQAGTHNINTNTGGVPVTANVHVQINDIDGPNNEEVFVPICSGDVTYIRIDSTATTGRTFGTVNGVVDTFSLIGDQGYSNQPNSGLEINYPNASNFLFGRTANNGFYIRLDNPTYSAFDTFDYECADFKPPVSADDTKYGTQGTPVTLSILDNDSLATENNNGPNNNSMTASEYGRQSVSLVAPAGATGINTDSDGDIIGFTVPGEGSWAFDDATGELIFTPLPDFVGDATPIDYTFDNALGISSPVATASVSISGIGVVKSSTFNDENSDGYVQVGETITYGYSVTAFGADPLNAIVLSETGFTGTGTAPVPTYQSGDNGDSILQVGETWLYFASYTIVATDLAAGNSIANQATASGQTPGGASVSDLSDSTGSGDGNGTGTSGPGSNNDDVTNTALPFKPITADNNDYSATPIVPTGGNTPSVFGNDQIDSASFNPADVIPSISNDGGLTGVVINADGTLTIPAGTAEGNYTVTYQICETANPSNCTTAQVTVVVALPPLSADDDTHVNVNGYDGVPNLGNVFDNDDNAGATPTLGDVTLAVVTPATPLTSGAPVPTLDANGNVVVPAMTPAGTYTIDYEICEIATPTNCDPATVSVTVVAAPINADDNDMTATPILPTGGTTPSVFDNDTLNMAAIDQSEITPSITSDGGLTGVVINADGTFTIPSGATEGTYMVTYKICEVLNPANCDTAIATVVVAFPPLSATDDNPIASNGDLGVPNLINVLANDDLNNSAPVIADVTINVTTPATPVIMGANVPVLDPATGNVSIPAGTPEGNYTIDYQLCETANPTNCDTATITVIVDAGSIGTGDDVKPPVNGTNGNANMGSALDNDSLSGQAADLTKLAMTITTPATPIIAGAPVPMVDPSTGIISVPAGTPAGPYTITYQICEILNPANCDTATVTLQVIAAPIDAQDITPAPVNATNGNPSLVNVLDGDTFNGGPANLTDIDLSVDTPAVPAYAGAPVPVLDPTTGNVAVPAGTPAGTYTIVYKICDPVNPSNCDTATVTIEVVPAQIDAQDNRPPVVDGAAGNPDLLNVLDNDTFNGGVATIANIDLNIETPATPLTTGAPVPVLDPATGQVSVPAGTPAGDYTIVYKICDPLNPSNCDTATVIVEVAAAQIVAVTDDYTALPIDPAVGGDIGNIFDNDTLNGSDIVPTDIKLTLTDNAGLMGVMISAEGLVTLPANTVPGNYDLTYEICETLNPDNCETAHVLIAVALYPGTGPQPDESLNNIPGMPVTIKVIANDPDPHNVIDASSLQIVGTNAPGAPLIVPGEGIWSVDPITGTITFTPENGFEGNPMPIDYVLKDKWGNALDAVSVTVTYQAAPAFSCTDIIGKVHQDFNANGRQDAGERGIAAVRLATVNGDLITTDDHGRYSIPCAALPRDHGSNFLLKLDTSSLPTGYRVTTENPRVIRMSAGLMSRLNFGVSVGNTVNIKVNANAFSGDIVSADLAQALGRMSGEFGSTPTTLVMTYTASPDESKASINRRFKAIERKLKRTTNHRFLSRSGGARLKFERVILRASR